jgi:signal transduction histidine kinase/ActR/RegA family two-component response regulator
MIVHLEMRDATVPRQRDTDPPAAAIVGGRRSGSRREAASPMSHPVSIRTRLLLLVLSVVLPAGAAGLWMIGQTYASERAARERSLEGTVRAMSMVIGRELEQRAAVARVLAQSRVLDSAPEVAPPQLEAFEQQAQRALVGLGGWIELYSAERDLVNTAREPRRAVAASAAPRALLSGPRFGPLLSDPSTGQLRASVVVPVERNGNTLLNLALMLRPEEVQRVIDEMRLPPDRVAAVLDPNGSIVARHPVDSARPGDRAPAALRARLEEQRPGVFRDVTLNGSAHAGYVSSGPHGWSFVAGIPHQDFVQGIPRQVWVVGLALLLLLGLALLAARWVAWRIEQPVASLKQAADRLSAGLPVRAAPTGIAECDDVAMALADASRKMRYAREDLEQQVASAVEQTREAEQRVSHSRRVEALGRLTGGFAHDFNNLLGVISNSAHLIQRASDAPELHVPVNATLRAVEAGSRLTENLLRFAGRQAVQPKTLDLRRFLPELQELVQSVLGPRIELKVSVAADTPRVTVDASELELALINLALNTREATQRGGHVWIEARATLPDETRGLPGERYAMIAFSDDGRGVDVSVAERAFEPFVTTKSVGQGAGLGLAQVHGFCVQAGGSARLDSTPGHGTTVTMTLPAAHEGPDAVRPRARVQRELDGLRVLLVEDHEQLGDVTAGLLATYGCNVSRAGTASEALAMLEQAPQGFDIVLSDIVMPGRMDGIAMARTIQQRWPKLPVVLNSGYTSAQGAAHDFAVLRKPCTPEALVEALQSARAPATQPASDAERR